MINVLVTVAAFYLLFGLLAGHLFIITAILHDVISGHVDPKHGAAWKSAMTYTLAATMMCPVLNLVWLMVVYRSVQNKFK